MKNLQVKIKTDLSTEPITTTEAKLYCHVTGTAEDSLFTILIAAARKALEKYTSSSFGEKVIHATWVNLPEDNELELPYGPIISVDHVYSIDSEGAEEEETLNTDYSVYGNQDAVIKAPIFYSTSLGARSIRVEYTAGYGDTLTEPLPDELKLAILKQIATDYQLRENISNEGATILSNASRSLAAPYRRKLWF
jgi:uncharacterized phiE125 gp8 family phage protein